MLVWVRFPCLHIEYYDRDVLMEIGENIGKPIRVDHTTSLTNNGMFTRMCVEVDITNPLVPKFKIKKRVRVVEYEGFYMVCFRCGIYDHSKDTCHLNVDGAP